MSKATKPETHAPGAPAGKGPALKSQAGKGPSTRDRILIAARSLFNRGGERNVTTNHIAAHLSISPGNLYYYFRNKSDILVELYSRHRERMLALLSLPAGTPFSIELKARLMADLAQAMWEDRYIYRDLEHILSESDAIAALHKQTFNEVFAKTLALHAALADAGLIVATPEEQRDLTYNAWIILTNWIGFLRTTVQVDVGHEDSQALINRGVYQILALEKAFMTPEARAQVDAWASRYYTALNHFSEPPHAH